MSDRSISVEMLAKLLSDAARQEQDDGAAVDKIVAILRDNVPYLLLDDLSDWTVHDYMVKAGERL